MRKQKPIHTTATLKTFLSITTNRLSTVPSRTQANIHFGHHKSVKRLLQTILRSIQSHLNQQQVSLNHKLESLQMLLKTCTNSLQSVSNDLAKLLARRAQLFEESVHLLCKLTTPTTINTSTNAIPLSTGFSFLPFTTAVWGGVHQRDVPRNEEKVGMRRSFSGCVSLLSETDRNVRMLQRRSREMRKRISEVRVDLQGCVRELKLLIRVCGEWKTVEMCVEGIDDALREVGEENLADVVAKEIWNVVCERWGEVWQSLESVEEFVVDVEIVDGVVEEISAIVEQLVF